MHLSQYNIKIDPSTGLPSDRVIIHGYEVCVSCIQDGPGTMEISVLFNTPLPPRTYYQAIIHGYKYEEALRCGYTLNGIVKHYIEKVYNEIITGQATHC